MYQKHNARATVTRHASTVHPMEDDLLFGRSAERIAHETGVDITTARRWKRQRKLPQAMKKLLKLLSGDLGAIHPKWKGWRLDVDGRLWTQEYAKLSFQPADIWGIPLLRARVGYERLRETFDPMMTPAPVSAQPLVQGDWVAQKWVANEVPNELPPPPPEPPHRRRERHKVESEELARIKAERERFRKEREERFRRVQQRRKAEASPASSSKVRGSSGRRSHPNSSAKSAVGIIPREL
jgi:hypothetical protein